MASSSRLMKSCRRPARRFVLASPNCTSWAVCILSCQFCSFARKKRDTDGFQFTVDEIVQKAREALRLGVTELHIVGGLHPELPVLLLRPQEARHRWLPVHG